MFAPVAKQRVNGRGRDHARNPRRITRAMVMIVVVTLFISG